MNTAVVLLLVLVACYTIIAADDLIYDLGYWIESGRSSRRMPILDEEDLRAEPQRRVALITPAWHEQDVIAPMLSFNDQRLDYDAYEVFVGTYPNDPDTQREVDSVAARIPRIRKVVNPQPGPTTKADNLNALISAIRRREGELGEHERFDVVMLHDAEDVIHPLELRVVNWHFARYPDVHMIQLPIFPLPVPGSAFTAGTYLDEFAELHTNDLPAREWLGAFVPSAGVATAWRREALDAIAADSADGRPFATLSLTEDYEVGLRINLDGMRSTFVRQFVRRLADRVIEPHAIRPSRADMPRKERGRRKRIELIATRAHFPHTFSTAVRQRTRWTLGIVFQAWQRWGWIGNRSTRLALIHDRKAPVAYVVMLLGYVFLAWMFVHGVLRRFVFHRWQPLLPNTRLVGAAVTVGAVLMLHRLLQRAIATGRVYGTGQGLLAILRLPWSNAVNMTATFKALGQFMRARRSGAPLTWDKTQHHVPGLVRQ